MFHTLLWQRLYSVFVWQCWLTLTMPVFNMLADSSSFGSQVRFLFLFQWICESSSALQGLIYSYRLPFKTEHSLLQCILKLLWHHSWNCYWRNITLLNFAWLWGNIMRLFLAQSSLQFKVIYTLWIVHLFNSAPVLLIAWSSFCNNKPIVIYIACNKDIDM